MMHMTFYWGRNVTLLFDSWKTNTWTSYALTLIACLIFSIFYQYMEDRRLRFQLLSSSSSAAASTTVDSTPLLNKKIFAGGNRWSVGRIVGSVLFGINSAIGYFLMLAVMSFNGGVFVAIVAGLAVGYLLFRSGGDDEQVVVVDNPCACA